MLLFKLKLHIMRKTLIIPLFCLALSMVSNVAGAQREIRVIGTVTDNSGETLVGVSVSVRGTTIGISTDVNGEYNLVVPSDTCVLRFSYIGFKAQEIPIGARRSISVVLLEDAAE